MICPLSLAMTRLACAVLFVFHLVTPGPLDAGQAPARVPAANLIQQGGYVLADNDRIIAAENSDTPFVPASTLKIITGLTALDILGPDYRFPTRIFSDAQENLYIQGSGDPFLLTENVTTIVHRLHELGLRRINHLVLDETAFAINTQADGNENSANPYDAWNSALAVNFNSIAIRVSPERTIAPDDPKVPPLPMMQIIGANLPPGHHRLNVNAFAAKGSLSNTQRYTGELFVALLQQKQIAMHGTIMNGATPPTATALLTSWSDRTVRDMVRLCLKYSNNFVANQLFLACGTARLGAPATWEKGESVLRAHAEKTIGIPESALVMVEGSGLSRRNRITPAAMLTALEAFVPHRELLSEKNGILLKSGTLTGVYCYAGYLPQQGDAPFVILLNQPQNHRDAILRLLIETGNKRNLVASQVH